MGTLDVEATFSQTLNAIEAVMRLSKQFTGADATGTASDDLCALMCGIRALLYREGAAYEGAAHEGAAFSDGPTDAARLREWLIGYCRKHHTLSVPTRVAQQFSSVRTRERLQEALEALTELQCLRVVREGRRKIIYMRLQLMKGVAMDASNNLGGRWGLAEAYRKDAAKAAALLADMGGEYEEIISETLDDRLALRAQLVENGDDDAEGIAAYLDRVFPFPQQRGES